MRSAAQHIKFHRIVAAVIVIGMATGAMADTKSKKESRAAEGESVEFLANKNSVALLMRELSAQTGRSIVVMNGLEMVQAGPYEKKKRTAQEWIERIAEDGKLLVQRNAAYDFVFSPGYEVVIRTSASASLDPDLAGRRTTFHIEFGTPLYAALALLSHSLQTTIVADNIVADARCGETHILNGTVGEVLDSLLQSARIPQNSLRALTVDNAVFLYSAGRPLRDPLRVETASEAKPDWLDSEITLYLPMAPKELAVLPDFATSVPLSACLPELERQTGLHFEADMRTRDLPVNPVAMPNVKLETALKLLIDQWPLPHFGYRASGNTVRFVYLGPPIAK